MLNTQANLFTLLLSPLEHGRFERLNTNVTGLGDSVRNEAGREGEKIATGEKKEKEKRKSSEILQRRMKNK